MAFQAAHAQQADQAPAPASASNQAGSSANQAVSPEDILRDIVVTARQQIGGGNMILQRQPETTSSVSAKAISERATIAGPLQIIATLPGVSTGQSDPYAMAQRSFIYIRGLPGSAIGWIVEDAPTIDQAFFQPYSETFVDPENLAGITVLPGSSRIVDPVQTAVAGEVILTARTPAENLGGFLEYSHGSYRANRYFGRIDTGDIAGLGLKAFASGSYTKAGTFNLPGTGDRTHVDFKAVKDWGASGTSTLFASYTDWSSLRSNTISLATFNQAKAADDFTIGNYAPTFVPGVTTNYYKLNYYQRQNIILSFKNEVNLSDRLTLTVVPYYHWTRTNSPGQTSVNPNSVFTGNSKATVNTVGLYLINGQIPAMSNSYQKHYALGVNAYAKYKVSDSNELLVGYWHDYWHIDAINNVTPIDQNGNSPDVWAENPLRAVDGTVIAGLSYRMHTNIDTISIGDQQKFFDERLTVEVGARYFHKSLSGINLLPGVQTDFSGTVHRFLPRATFAFDMNSKLQVYGNIISSARPPSTINAYPVTYNISTGRVAQAARPDIGMEHSLGQELGFRYHDSTFTLDAAIFNKLIKNRQLSASTTLNGANVSATVPIGTQRVKGATVELGLSPIHGFAPYFNAQYLEATTESDFFTGVDYLPTKGKTSPGTPKWTAVAGVNYAHGPLFANFLFRYTGPQYSTLMNDQQMPAYHLIDLGFGYRLPRFLGQDASIKLNITNLENKPYLGVISTTQPNAVATRGLNGTLVPASTPVYTLSSPRSISLTISSAF
ncbi:iron complex outermembrane receptor protein [Novosphingobium sp. SG751A]|uniref:TonB-dependent receptor n=1 Tax=Novosphingobium sp. SG751A TaxID=2587000 RepID=UPI00155319C4|nr:TonB-dependent receptor [Novosphingobium sp. SG751A]NOW44958.1 iron complex outermembrane receptor protein [Novosphingobium sp. SG751A]